jgi:CHASE3 domain sensor protein
MPAGQTIPTVARPKGFLPLPPWALAGILVKIVAITLIATSGHRALVNRGEAARRTTATLAALNDLTQLQLTLLEAETGHRGFLLSRDDRFLQPFSAARQELPGTLRALEAAFAENPEQRRRLDGVATLARTVLDQMEGGISARQDASA